MYSPTDRPLLVFAISFTAMWLAARVGSWFHSRRGALDEETHQDFGFILAATLSMLGIIIGFSFSMATNRYDQRKNYEEAEANAIGTEYVRADFLPAADAATVRALLSSVEHLEPNKSTPDRRRAVRPSHQAIHFERQSTGYAGTP